MSDDKIDIPPELQDVFNNGSLAWSQLKTTKDWGYWMVVGVAHVEARSWIVRRYNTNPGSSKYNRVFGQWLQTYGFSDMDAGDRNRLFDIMENRGQVEAWRATLSYAERSKQNNPSYVWRLWKKRTDPQQQIEKKNDVAPKSYPFVIGVWASVMPSWAVMAAVCGAEPV